MHGVLPTRIGAASFATDQTVSESFQHDNSDVERKSTDQMDSDFREWFGETAQQLLGADAGFILSLLTGVHERSCYRYASKQRPATGYIIFKILRSAHGQQWLNAIMSDCTEQWWLDMQRAARIGKAAIAEADK